MSEEKNLSPHSVTSATNAAATEPTTADAREATTFDLKFIECAHVIKIPLRVYPDPHAPRPAATRTQRNASEFLSRPVPVPGVCPTCHNKKTAAGPIASAGPEPEPEPEPRYQGIHPAALQRRPEAPTRIQPDTQREPEPAVPPP